ncbi:MAG: hypothetical protein EP343_24375 [Deltaproteobacteria bacterium]|nr:MAG: hypothetical protein EP343_24375 [Deltaproteobacteria bacterium]
MLQTSPHWLLSLLLGGFLTLATTPPRAEAGTPSPLQVRRLKNIKVSPPLATYKPLRVLSFNVAHGSNNIMGVVPIFTSASTIKKRLDAIAQFFRTVKADVVGLQEADGPSWWSGRFHHVNYLARAARYPFAGLGIHVQSSSKRYGTALLSRWPLKKSISYRFKPLSSFKKGFVLGQVQWPGKPHVWVDIVSLHLDPQQKTVQTHQLNELVKVLKKRKNPVIVMGDFNTTWYTKKSPLKIFAKAMNLKAYQPANKQLYTHRFPRAKRIDWIFISQGLRFVTYSVIPKEFTDHYPVMADIALGKQLRTSQPTSQPASRPSSLPKP